MKIAIIVGTRPEVIKMAPVIRECQLRSIPFIIIHSNQHYSPDMDNIFFTELNLPNPDYNLHVGSGLHSNQTGNILIKIEPILEQEKPDLVLVQGDTNTVLAGALAASKLNIKVGHIEAGLRSYDKTMPEETNRVLTDHMSDFLFSVSNNQTKVLKAEGISPDKIYQVGNTISDALFQHIPLAEQQSTILSQLKLTPKKYLLLTAHRASNVDVKAHLLALIDLVCEVAQTYQEQIVWPIHPRTQKKLQEYQISLDERITLTPPLGYLDFIQLQKNASLIMTDSGGIQEEACMLQIPCITLRENTERPETIEVGANVLVGRDQSKAMAAIAHWKQQSQHTWHNPFGDGTVAAQIIDAISAQLSPKTTPLKASVQESKLDVCVIGLGYMGLPISCLIAQGGSKVTGVDLNADKVEQLNRGICVFDEAGLDELLQQVITSQQFHATTQVSSADIYLIAVPTPHHQGRCDLSYVMSAVNSIIPVAKDGQLVIIESTIAPGTSQQLADVFAKNGLNIEVVHCPERAIPGQTLHELVNNDRIIGASSEAAGQLAKRLYSSFVKGEFFTTSTTTAECVKLIENTSRDVSIAFANELAAVASELEIDVFEAIQLANRHPRVNILTPGAGVGGHCIPIDPWFLVENTEAGDLIRHARKINDQRPIDIANKVIAQLSTCQGKKVALLGVAYKPNVDDCRETPAEAILQHLQAAGLEVVYHDPFVKQWDCPKVDSLEQVQQWADLMLIVTEHDCYQQTRPQGLLLNSCGILVG